MAGICYSVHRNRIQEGYHPGFVMREDETLTSLASEPVHYLYLKAIDASREDATWGRLSFEGRFEENMVCFVYVTAMNEAFFFRENEPRKIEDFLCDAKESADIKKRFMEKVSAKRLVNREEILLYELKGRYLYLFIEVLGEGECTIKNLRIEQEGDNFMQTFPEVYRERNSFFHRFLSVFSTIYNEFDERIDALSGLLDIDSCPKELLPVYAGWMGVDVKEDFFTEEILRQLVSHIYELNRLKGTKAVLERLTEIILGEKALILEKNAMEEYIEAKELKNFERLYGSSTFDVTILTHQVLNETLKNQLMYVLNQYKPIRSNLYVVQLQKTGMLDAYSYLDMNARIPEKSKASLDDKATMDSVMMLQ